MVGNKLERELVRLRNAMEGPDKRDRATLTKVIGFLKSLVNILISRLGENVALQTNDTYC